MISSTGVNQLKSFSTYSKNKLYSYRLNSPLIELKFNLIELFSPVSKRMFEVLRGIYFSLSLLIDSLSSSQKPIVIDENV